mgnify:CR=1 FL=1
MHWPAAVATDRRRRFRRHWCRRRPSEHVAPLGFTGIGTGAARRISRRPPAAAVRASHTTGSAPLRGVPVAARVVLGATIAVVADGAVLLGEAEADAGVTRVGAGAAVGASARMCRSAPRCRYRRRPDGCRPVQSAVVARRRRRRADRCLRRRRPDRYRFGYSVSASSQGRAVVGDGAADAGAGLAAIGRGTAVVVVALGAVHDRAAAAGAGGADVVGGAFVDVVAVGAVGLHRRCYWPVAGSQVPVAVTEIRRRADHRIRADAAAGLAAIGRRAAIAVVARGPVGLDRGWSTVRSPGRRSPRRGSRRARHTPPRGAGAVAGVAERRQWCRRCRRRRRRCWRREDAADASRRSCRRCRGCCRRSSTGRAGCAGCRCRRCRRWCRRCRRYRRRRGRCGHSRPRRCTCRRCRGCRRRS